MVNTRLFIATLAKFTGRSMQELEAMPEKEFNEHLIKYINKLSPEEKERILSQADINATEWGEDEIFEEFPKGSIAAHYPGPKFHILKDIKLEQDFEFPPVKYVLEKDVSIYAKDCELKISLGTEFYFDDDSGIYLQGGKLNAQGVKFLTIRRGVQANIMLQDVNEAKLEDIVIKGFKTKPVNRCGITTITSPLSLLNSEVEIRRALIENNESEASGGGLYITDSSVLIEDSQFLKNKAGPMNSGGGIMIYQNSEVNIKKCKFIGNGGCSSGGAIYIGGNTEATIENTEITKNRCYKAGSGICTSGRVEISESIIKQNKLMDQGKNDIWVTPEGLLIIDKKTAKGCEISGSVEISDEEE